MARNMRARLSWNGFARNCGAKPRQSNVYFFCAGDIHDASIESDRNDSRNLVKKRGNTQMSQALSYTRRRWRLLIALMGSLSAAYGQRYDITPLFGARYGGNLNLEQQGAPNVEAHLADSIAYGVAGGFRFDDEGCEGCNLFEFRWMRQDTHIGLKLDPLNPTPTPLPTPLTSGVSLTAGVFRPAVTLDHFLGDLTHEWTIRERQPLSRLRS